MIEHKNYQCEVCGATYADPQVAIRCEKSHILPKKISNYKYDSFVNRRFPEYITVTFTDGSILLYKKGVLENDIN
jgi:hypothetical protein